MKRALCGLLTLFVGGCGVLLETPRAKAYRLCQLHGLQVDDVNSHIFVLNDDKNRGFIAAVAIAEINSTCGFNNTCLNCGLAIIDSVYP